MADSQSRVFKALESTESLLASLLGRSSLPPEPVEDVDGVHSAIDVEQSLILGVGERFDTPRNNFTRQSVSEALPDPRDTLTSIVCRSLRTTSLTTLSLEERLQQKENELEITAKLGLVLLERKELLEKEVTRLTDQSGQLEQRLLQARHELGQKESLLQLYYVQEEQNEVKEITEPSPPEWVRALTEERSQLKEENQTLWTEKQELEIEAQKTLQKSQALVKQCVDQLTEAKHELLEVQMEMDRQTDNSNVQQERLDRATEENVRLKKSKKQLEDDLEEIRERLTDSMLGTSQLTAELTDWSEKYETCYIMLQDAKEETKMLKELTDTGHDNNRSGVHTPSSEAEHGSIVSEIEAVLRQEILAASTLDERPPSPSTYAKQRTMIVMETVKAATLATAKKLEKLAEEQRKKEGELLHPVPVDPNDPQRPRYMSPQKLQIVKPMEGSATLLQWKLLATPQLGGTPLFFSKSDRPGIKQRKLDSPPATPTIIHLTPPIINSMQQNKRWSSTSDLSHHKIRNNPAFGRRNIHPVPLSENGLSTVNKVRQNIWGLFTSPGKNNKTKTSQGKGLEELLLS